MISNDLQSAIDPNMIAFLEERKKESDQMSEDLKKMMLEAMLIFIANQRPDALAVVDGKIVLKPQSAPTSHSPNQKISP